MSIATETATAASSPAAPAVPTFLELEITGLCQLRCTHCYADSGPQGGPGTMTPENWEHVIDQAAAIGMSMVQFIGGEPTLSPALPQLVRYALAAGLKAYVYSNLVHVTPELWELFAQPGVSLGTSWYSADENTHAKITGSRASHARTAANIAEAVARGIFVRAAIVEVTEDQDTQRAAEFLRGVGVTDIRIRPQQDLGRAARDGNTQDTAQLCGRCGENRAAIMADGQLTPCVVSRWLDCGNVKTTSLAAIFASPAWQARLATVPRRHPDATAPDDCPPASDGNDCPPASCQ
jgi:sulfatase maturation enzyme AslB (radical SAM superfamily)